MDCFCSTSSKARLVGQCLFVAVAACSFASGQQVHFVREHITVRVLGDSCEVEGTYWFLNADTVSAHATVWFPFPPEGELPTPHKVELSDPDSEVLLPFREGRNGVTFALDIPAGATRSYRVRYWQMTPAGTMTYVLTTTHAWSAPLEEARFIVEVPRPYALRSSSYLLEETRRTSRSVIYQFQRTNFMPAYDLILTWQREPS